MIDHDEYNQQMRKRMRKMLIIVGIVFGIIIAYHYFQKIMIKLYISKNQSPIVTVSTLKVGYSTWQPQLQSVGSMRAIRGVNVTTQLAGMVETIYFTPGTMVKQGTLLVQLNIDSDVALLHSLQASLDLAKITYKRDQAQFRAQGVSQSVVDTDKANLQNFEAQVAQQVAVIAKKTITAPFTGRLGISAVNPGQYVNAGDKVVTLQQMDPLYVDFYIPQQELQNVKLGQTVEVNTDNMAKKFVGKITTIDPLIDVNTRNVAVEATIPNVKSELAPGMFTKVTVLTGQTHKYLTLPHSAVTFNPYGDIVYIVTDKTKDKSAKEKDLVVSQSFVTTGEMRGDQIVIQSGLKAGDEVVSSGQVKLKNGSRIAVNNSVQPANNPDPSTPDQ